MEYETRRKPSYTMPLLRTGDNTAPGRVFTQEAESRWADEDEQRQIKMYGRGWSREA